MKKLLSLFICLLLLASLCACDAEQALETADAVLDIVAALEEADAPENAAPAASAHTEAAQSDDAPAASAQTEATQSEASVTEDGVYTTKEDVALYLHLYGHLPQNFITKTKAREKGWNGGGLDDVLPGMCIGGGGFQNSEGLLPAGHTYKECDIDTLGKSSRGAKRIVYSDDGYIYYTDDHYESFTLLYGPED